MYRSHNGSSVQAGEIQSCSRSEPFSQPRRQPGTDDLVLARVNIVLHAAEGHPMIVGVIHQERCPRIAISRLAYAAGVDEVPLLLRELQVERKLDGYRSLVIIEHCSYVRMAEKSDP